MSIAQADWTVRTGSWDDYTYWTVESGGKVICMQPVEFFAYPEAAFIEPDESSGQDIAHLIAAAPDLLALCKAVLSALDTHQAYDKDYRPNLRAAIAKAENGPAK